MVKFLLQRPIAVLMAFTACFIVGLVTYFSLPVSLLPDIAIPQITIQVTGENSSARELENTVVTPVRRQLLQVDVYKRQKFIFFAESRFFPPCGSLLKEKEVKSDVKVV